MSSRGGPRELAEAVVRTWIDALDPDDQVSHEPGARPGEYVVQLPGEHKLRTTVSVIVGDHSLSVTAFVIRNPDENHEVVYRWLLERNIALRQLAFAADHLGDVYLVGRLPLSGVDVDTFDALMGEVLTAADGAFDELLVLGFLGAMRREWAWRVSRGESTRNLAAFRHLLDDDGGQPG